MQQSLKLLTLVQVASLYGIKYSDVHNGKLHKNFKNYSPVQKLFLAEESEVMAKKTMILERFNREREEFLRSKRERMNKVREQKLAKRASASFDDERRRKMSENAKRIGLGTKVGLNRGDTPLKTDDPNRVLKERVKLLKQIANLELDIAKRTPLTPLEEAVLRSQTKLN